MGPGAPLRSMTSPRPWYATLAGRRTARRLARVIAPAVHLGPTQRLLALGYPPPILTGLDPTRLERLTILLTHSPPHRWPARGPNHAASARADALPLPPNLYDQALLIHALDEPHPAAVLAETWRILAPASELILVVPNRLGRWLDRGSPFASGQAYTEGELAALLETARFEVRSQRTALGPVPGAGPQRRHREADPFPGQALAQLGQRDVRGRLVHRQDPRAYASRSRSRPTASPPCWSAALRRSAQLNPR